MSRLKGLITRRISAKIIVPYVIVMAILAAGGAFVVIRLVAGSLDERLLNQLVDAGRKANDTIVTMEDEHLRMLRTIAFTEDVDTALASGNVNRLATLIRPIQINNQIGFIVVLDRQGRPLVATEFKESNALVIPAEDDIQEWDIVQSVLQGKQDEYGDKFAAFRSTSRGHVLFTAGPVKDEAGTFQGVVLVGTHGSDVIVKLTRESLAAITFYEKENGAVIGSSLPYASVEEAAGIEEDRFGAMLGGTSPGGTVLRRKLGIGERQYDEMVGQLEVRKKAAIVMGVAVPSEYIEQKQLLSRDQLIALFVTAVAAVLLMGIVLSRRITQPMLRLVAANRRVSAGQLDVYVPPTTEDETGVLTESFNEMVAGLRERERVKDTFGKYMSKEVTDYLLSNEITMGGEAREITIIMSDIRGFTSISEGLDPKDLVALLNRYFSNQVNPILRNRGRVDKYMGDAILASFGAPVDNPEHAKDAVRAALLMRENLKKFNEEIMAEGIPEIRIGIGINTGMVVVGNIGSEERLEYTIIGDAVNTTQRTEDLTKEFQTDILITEETYEKVKDIVDVGEAHLVTIRGRTQTTAIFPLLGLKENAPAAVAAEPVPVGANEHANGHANGSNGSNGSNGATVPAPDAVPVPEGAAT